MVPVESRLDIEPFVVRVDEAVLADLRARIAATRWPSPSPAGPWEQGADLTYLQDLLSYWASGFDWAAREREINQYAHFRAEIDGVCLHFVHARATHGGGTPLILTHGWPSTFVELLGLVPLLTDPTAHGTEGPAFDLVIPSLPGYGYSERPLRTGITPRYTAGLWHRLMRGLGYERYGAGGGDFGASVATWMALDDPGPLTGLHLTNLDVVPYTGPGSRPLSAAEKTYLEQNGQWAAVERGYSAIQSTKPQTVGYGLNDSPAGLAAWIAEKWRSWTDSGGDLDAHIPRDFMLATLTVYWATQSITTSLRDYYDDRRCSAQIGPHDYVGVPTAVAVFAHECAPEGVPPREWAQRLYNIRRWTPMPRGGHFAPFEEPELVAGDIAAFFADLVD